MAKRVSVDRWLFTVSLLLVFLGLVMVFSASAVMAKERFGSPYTFALRQLARAEFRSDENEHGGNLIRRSTRTRRQRHG